MGWSRISFQMIAWRKLLRLTVRVRAVKVSGGAAVVWAMDATVGLCRVEVVGCCGVDVGWGAVVFGGDFFCAV